MYLLIFILMTGSFAAGWVMSYRRTMNIYRKCTLSHPLTVPYISVARETVIK